MVLAETRTLTFLILFKLSVRNISWKLLPLEDIFVVAVPLFVLFGLGTESRCHFENFMYMKTSWKCLISRSNNANITFLLVSTHKISILANCWVVLMAWKRSFIKLLLPGPNGNSEGSEITLIWNCPCNFVFNIGDSRINFVLELLLLKVGFKIKLLKKPPDLKETWGQSYNFCLNWSFLILKQNGIKVASTKISKSLHVSHNYHIC